MRRGVVMALAGIVVSGVACGPANVAGGSAATGATGGTAAGTPVPRPAPTAGATNNPTPPSIGSSPTNAHGSDSTGATADSTK